VGALWPGGSSGGARHAERVPANGYRTYPAERGEAARPVLNDPPTSLNTPFYKAAFDLKRGGLSSLVDKQTGRELVDQTRPYALGQFLHERFDAKQMLAFHNAYGRPGYNWPKDNLPTNTTYAALTPPAWSILVQRTATADIGTLTATDTLGLAKGITLVFTFPRQQPFVDVEWRVTDKTPDPLPEGGWLCFPFAVAQPQFLLGRLGGPIDPTKDIIPGANRHYFCLNSGLTITGQDGTGIGLCPLDSPCVSLDEPGLWRFSLDYVPKKPSVFVNLYNNEWNTNFPEWQEGSWSSRVRLWLTEKYSSVARSPTVPSWEARLPLLAGVADGPAGKLPPTQAGLTISRSGVLVTAFGQNPDGPGTLLRLWEQAGVSADCAVAFPPAMKVESVQPVDLRGQPLGQAIAVKAGGLSFPLRAYAPASFLLQPY
jgi:alpha-mannosidase